MKIKNQVAIGIVCMFLGVILSMQYKVFQENLANDIVPFKRQTELTNELISLKEEKDMLIQELNEKEATLLAIEESASKDNAIIKNLTDTVREYEILAGMTDVIGEGIIITIDHPPTDASSVNNVNVVNDYDNIVLLINELNAAGAEAVSINEQRLTSLSEIRAAGLSINVNFVPQTVPITIKAIGKASALEGAVNYRFGLVNELRKSGLLVDVKTLDEVNIPKYHGIIDFDYVQTIEEE